MKATLKPARKSAKAILLTSLFASLSTGMTSTLLAESFTSNNGKEVPDIGALPPVTANPDNLPTPERIKLGQSLFFDNRISGSGTINCATCHVPDQGWTVQAPLSPAHPGFIERRNSPTLLNVGYVNALIWDGRAPTLEKQAIGSTKNPLHKNRDINELMKVFNNDPKVVKMFEDAYGKKPNIADYGKAIAVFQRHFIITGDSPFDKYMKGDKSALTKSEVRGMALFKGKANCISCHSGPNFTDSSFYNVGLKKTSALDDEPHQKILRFDAKRKGVKEWEKVTSDTGRYLVTHDPKDKGKFKTPTLRNLVDTKPYMHDGRFQTLDEVLEFFNNGGDTIDNGSDQNHSIENKDTQIKPLKLSQTELADLKSFLLTLRGSLPKIDVASITTQADLEPTLDGKKLYEGKGTCVNCHQATGLGILGAFPPLAGNKNIIDGDGSYVAKTILHGRTGELKINGHTFNSTMPAIGTQQSLNDAEVAAIATYIRSTWGNKATAVTEDIVKKNR